MRFKWFAGPPPGRGHWWVVWRGTVVPVEVGPAVIYRDDPNAKLLLKTLGGLAYEFERNAKDISHHAVLEGPAAP